jgi:hypothetical protein
MTVDPKLFGAIAGFALGVVWATEGADAFLLALALGAGGYALVALVQRPRIIIALLERLERR